MLEKYRDEIDGIDTQIIELLEKRFAIVDAIGKYKKQHNMPALQESRWTALLQDKVAQWKQKNISEECITNIWNSIHSESLKIEE